MEITLDRYEEIGIHLQHGGMTDDEIDEYFAHHGVKGMKWGRRSGKQKLALVGGALVGAEASARSLRRFSPKLSGSITGLGVSTAAGVVGYKLTKKILDRHKNTKYSDIHHA